MDYFVEKAPDYIKFPTNGVAIEAAATEFEVFSGFPGVIGCIDGSYINIKTPKHKIKNTYVNRHDLPSLTLQGICDASKRFIDVFTGVPGKIHDSRIFKLSDISERLPTICGSHYHLLGDSAYPLREYLLTPYKNYGNITPEERNFNLKLCQTRVKIENAFGLLKGRFLQLTQIYMHDVDKISKFIISCCVLHNICIGFNDLLEDDEIVREDAVVVPVAPVDSEERLKRLVAIKQESLKERFSTQL